MWCDPRRRRGLATAGSGGAGWGRGGLGAVYGVEALERGETGETGVEVCGRFPSCLVIAGPFDKVLERLALDT